MHAPSGTTGEIWYTRKPVHGNWPFRSARCCWRTPVVPSAGWPPWRGTEPACLGPCPSGIKKNYAVTQCTEEQQQERIVGTTLSHSRGYLQDPGSRLADLGFRFELL